MPRPTTRLGSWGKIKRTTKNGRPAAVAHFHDWDGVLRPVMRVGRTKADAEARLLEALQERTDLDGDLLSGDSKFSVLAEQWLEVLAASDLSDGTKRTYVDSVKRIILPPLADVRLREISTPLLDRVLTKVSTKNGRGTAKTARTILMQMCAYAVRKGAMKRNAAEGTETYTPKKKAVSALGVEGVREIRQLMVVRDTSPDKAGRKRYTQITDVVDCYIGTGARTNEVLALKWDIISADCRQIHLCRTVVEIDGKVDIQDKPKTDSSNRVVTVPQHVADMLLQRRVNSKNELVFPSLRGTVMRDGNLMRMWADALAGTPYEGVTPVDFRRAVATLLAREVGADAAADQLGHHDSSVTRKHYIERKTVGPEQAREVLGTMFES